jgi:outer membrane lipoprotein-sorting protein
MMHRHDRRRQRLALALLALLPAGCGSNSDAVRPVSPGAESSKAATPEEAVTTFYDSKTKHGLATFRSGGSQERVEFWFAEDGRYRLTWYYPEEKTDEIEKYGPVRIHMISPDGTTVYYARPEAEASELAPVRAEKQQWTFNGPPGWAPEAGVEEDGYVVFTYTPEKLWDIEGASQRFYLYDMEIYTKDGEVAKIAMRTSGDKVPEAELTDSEFTIDEYELDADIAPEVFELPYPE